MRCNLRQVEEGDALLVFEQLREREGHLSRDQVYDAIADSVFTLVWTVDDCPGAVCGSRLASILDNRAYVWMLGTVLIDRYPVSFVRHSRRALRCFTERFGQVYGEVRYDFAESERWLRWLGCDFISDEGKVKIWTRLL